jgi:hypothetical protein
MTTSKRRSSRYSGPALSPRARGVSFGDDTLVVQLEDGRQISVPIAWFPRLAEAMSAHLNELDNWRLIGGGIGVHWPGLDEDISVENLLATRDELLAYHDDPALDGQHRHQAVKTMNRRGLGRPRLTVTEAGDVEPPATPPPPTL